MARSAFYHQANLIHGGDACAPNRAGFPTINRGDKVIAIAQEFLDKPFTQ